MNRNLILIFIALFTWGIGEGMFFYFQPIYLAELGADPLLIGSILGAAGLAMTIVHAPAGHLADRIGRLPMLRAAWLMGLFSAGCMALGTNLWTFSAGLILYSFTAFVASPLNSYTTAARGGLSVGRALTLMSAAFNLGAALGPLTGGWLGDTFGLRSIYFAAFGTFVISTIVIFLLAPQPRDEHDPLNPPPGLNTNPRFISFLGISVFAMFAMYLPQPLTPNFLRDERGLVLSAIGFIGSLGNLGNAIINLLLGYINTRRGFLISQLLSAAFVGLIWLGTGIPTYALAYFLLGGYRAARVLAAATVRELVHPAQMGLAYGLMETANAIPIIAAPILAGFLYKWKPEAPYPTSLILLALSIIVSLSFIPRGQPASATSA